MKAVLPVPRTADSLFQWAKAFVIALVNEFERIPKGVPSGYVMLKPTDVPLDPDYLECDGAEYQVATYPALARALDNDTTPGNFEVPDFTGINPTGLIYVVKT